MSAADRLDAGLNIEFGVDVVDMRLYSAWRNVQTQGDLLIGEAFIHEAQHLELARTEQVCCLA